MVESKFAKVLNEKQYTAIHVYNSFVAYIISIWKNANNSNMKCFI